MSFNGEGNEVNTSRFADYIEEEHVYYEKMVKGYPFIFLGSESWGQSILRQRPCLSERRAAELAGRYVEKRSKSEKPMFVFFISLFPPYMKQQKKTSD